jgi:hypothetical protein
MQLLVGCTLTQEDVDDIKKGYDVREAVTRTAINRIPAYIRISRGTQEHRLSGVDDRAWLSGREDCHSIRSAR